MTTAGLTPIPDHHHRPGFKYPKNLLAHHLTTPHQQPDGSTKRSAMPSKDMMRWTREELERTHREFHQQ